MLYSGGNFSLNSFVNNFMIRPLETGEIIEVIQHCLSSLEPEDSGNEAMRYIRGGIRSIGDRALSGPDQGRERDDVRSRLDLHSVPMWPIHGMK